MEQLENSLFEIGLEDNFKELIRKEDGYINATKLCQLGGKYFYEWKRIKKN
jgi:hypothetical protein